MDTRRVLKMDFLRNLILCFIAINVFGMLFCTGESLPLPKLSHYVHYTTRSAYP